MKMGDVLDMARFTFEGHIRFIKDGTIDEHEYYGKIVADDDDKSRTLELFCIATDPQESFNALISMGLRINWLQPSSKDFDPSVLMESNGDYYTTKIGFIQLGEDGKSASIPILNTIYSCDSKGYYPHDEEMFDGMEFYLESNENVRKVLTENMTFKCCNGHYEETGNQYSRSIKVKFLNPQKLCECKKIIRSIVSSRTLIDGFQNFEADVVLFQDNKKYAYNYLSRRITRKYYWYMNARFSKIEEKQYVALIEHIHKIEKRPTQYLLDICEYLHTPGYSLPTSRYMEIMTTYEGFASQYFKKNKVDKKEWSNLHNELKEVVEKSGLFETQKEDIRTTVDCMNPAKLNLRTKLNKLLTHSLKHLGVEASAYDFQLLLDHLVKVRNWLSHDPAAYLDNEKLQGNDMIHAIVLLREMSIVLLLTKEDRTLANDMKAILHSSDDLKKEILLLIENLNTSEALSS